MLEFFPQVLDMPIQECGEPLVDIRVEKKIEYHPILDSKEAFKAGTKLRRTVYKKLLKVQKELKKKYGYRFRILGGYRSIKSQVDLFEKYYKINKKEFPNATEQELFDKTKRFVSPLKLPDGRRNVPPHSTGAAVDVEILDENGNVVDMGMEILKWQQVDKDLCKPDCKKISLTAQENRKKMANAFYKFDFVGHPTEFWHFSYGDRLWAVCQSRSYAFYDSIELE